MPTLVFPTAAVLERIEGIGAFQIVGNSVDLAAALETSPRNAPAVFVLTETVGGVISFSGPPIQQSRTTQIKCVLWVRNHSKASAVRAEMDALLAQLDARFAGWSPGLGFEDLRLSGSRDEAAHGQYLIVQAVFESGWEFSAHKQP